MKKNITIGSRGSLLALTQAESVAEKIKEINSSIQVTITKVVTKGDRDRNSRLDWMEGVGVFVKELEEALLDGRIDLAVHSLKDMPTEIPEGLCLAGVTRRVDPRDVLICRDGGLARLPAGSRVGTGSLRRAAQIAAYRSDIEVCGVRGNVDTRLRKVSSGELDGVVLAAAAMHRLGWEDKISEYLSVENFLPAVGQGALAIETRSNESGIISLISQINDLPTWQGVTAERAFLKALGGGCSAPIAALGKVEDGMLHLDGMVAGTGGKKLLRAFETGKPELAENIGVRLAQKLLAMGAGELISEAKAK